MARRSSARAMVGSIPCAGDAEMASRIPSGSPLARSNAFGVGMISNRAAQASSAGEFNPGPGTLLTLVYHHTNAFFVGSPTLDMVASCLSPSKESTGPQRHRKTMTWSSWLMV
jgi:hypothetical protein